MSEKSKIIVIGADMNRSEIAAALATMYTGNHQASIVVFLEPWESHNKKIPIEEIIAQAPDQDTPIKDKDYEQGPSKLNRRKEANTLRTIKNNHFKTKLKSLKR